MTVVKNRPNSKKRVQAPKQKRVVTVSNEVKLSPDNPIPKEYTGVSYYSLGGSKYIPYLSKDDNFFSVLQTARIESTTQSACVNTKTNYTIGKGLVIDNMEEEAWPPLFKAFSQRANPKKETLNSVLKEAFGYFYGAGNVPIEIVKGEVGGKRFLHVFVHNVLDSRLSKNEDGEIDSMVISKLFRREGILQDGDKVASIPLYDYGSPNRERSWIVDPKSGVSRTGIWLQNYYTGYDDYGMPSSLAGLTYQVIEYQGARYNLDNLENNMVIGGAIVLAGNLDQTEADKLGRKVIRQHTGSGKRGRIVVFSSESGIEQSKWMPFDTRKEGSYKELMSEARDMIILANEWDSVLAGLQTDSSLGKGSGYLKEVYEQKLKTVISPVQNFFVESLLGPLKEIAKDWLGEDWSSLDFIFEPMKFESKSALSTPEGINSFLDIIKAVAGGYYSREAAVQLVSRQFGITEAEAELQIGEINVRTESIT